MTIKERISSFIRHRRMTTEERIEYLTYLHTHGLDFNTMAENYVSEEKVIVKNVIQNMYSLYNKDKLTIKQIMQCEDIGIKFEVKKEIKDKIEFLKKAISEGIILSDITLHEEKYSNNLIFKYILELRESFEKNELNEEEINTCRSELKIIISDEEKKEIILKKVQESVLKNVVVSSDIKKNLNIT